MPDCLVQDESTLTALAPKSEILRFAAVGVVGTAVHYGVLVALVELGGVDPVAGTLCGFIVAAFASFVLNSVFTFRVRLNFTSALLKNYVSLAFGLAINVGTVALLTHLATPYIFAQLVATVLAFIWNYLASRFIVFRK
ncbi:GtrA family protein [Novosphingobium flavum]|uniref:GtrA family protein n=1 Tax=Novosphingobium flavum TaxID=1778672 RepID=A0A7X1FQM3_9SPHN|nr:GtrA family protein [Novosphingobium flavum]MBC2665153.1 GtrA family protein [Novosphingobium flavum]